MNNINKKSILIAIAVLMVGLLITGGTYAYLTVAMTVTNGNYATSTHCFNVTYSFEEESQPQNLISSIVNRYNSNNVDLNNPYTISTLSLIEDDDDDELYRPLDGFKITPSLQLEANKSYALSFDASYDTLSDSLSFSGNLYPYASSNNGIIRSNIVNGNNVINFSLDEGRTNVIELGLLHNRHTYSESHDITFSNFKLYEADSSPTLFPSADAIGGISEWVSANADPTCALTGKGTLKMHIDSGTSNILTGPVASHCENANTLETQEDYTNQADCIAVAGNKWVTDGTALKYAVFSGNNLYNSGYIKSTDIGNDITVHDNFSVTTTSKRYDVYVWLDGYLTDDNYYDLAFDSSIKMITFQVKSTETYPGDTPLVEDYLIQLLNKLDPSDERLYQRVEYIKSSGTQYIDTGFTPNQNTSVELQLNGLVSSGNQDYFGTSTSSNGYSYGFYDGGSNVYDNYNDDKSVKSGHISGMMTVKKNKNVTTVTGSYNFNYTHSSTTFTSAHSLYLFARWKSTGAFRPATMECYEFKIWDDDTLVRDFIPVYRKSDNVAGLFDTINGVFYTNAATSGNDFTVGPDVNS